MKRVAGALLGVLTYATVVYAGPGDACGVAAHLVHADASLPRVAMAIKKKSLTVVVAGTASLDRVVPRYQPRNSTHHSYP